MCLPLYWHRYHQGETPQNKSAARTVTMATTVTMTVRQNTSWKNRMLNALVPLFFTDKLSLHIIQCSVWLDFSPFSSWQLLASSEIPGRLEHLILGLLVPSAAGQFPAEQAAVSPATGSGGGRENASRAGMAFLLLNWWHHQDRTLLKGFFSSTVILTLLTGGPGITTDIKESEPVQLTVWSTSRLLQCWVKIWEELHCTNA